MPKVIVGDVFLSNRPNRYVDWAIVASIEDSFIGIVGCRIGGKIEFMRFNLLCNAVSYWEANGYRKM